MRVLAVLVLLPLLAGCTDSDWNKMLSFGGSDRADSESTEVAATEPAPAPAAAPAPIVSAQAAATPNPFCLGIARQDAMSNDFDTGTQQKVAARSYQQCVQIFGGAE